MKTGKTRRIILPLLMSAALVCLPAISMVITDETLGGVNAQGSETGIETAAWDEAQTETETAGTESESEMETDMETENETENETETTMGLEPVTYAVMEEGVMLQPDTEIEGIDMETLETGAIELTATETEGMEAATEAEQEPQDNPGQGGSEPQNNPEQEDDEPQNAPEPQNDDPKPDNASETESGTMLYGNTQDIPTDSTAPTLNAAVSNGMLIVVGNDTESGVKAIYINGYEFTELINGAVIIRLQQFDSGYPYFIIQAMDMAGNMSVMYTVPNPYYIDPEAESDGTESDATSQLPASAEPTAPTSATATVTEHVDMSGDKVTSKTTTKENTTKEGTRQDTETATTDDGQETQTETAAANDDTEKGKEFYTIQTASDKVFYLIIDKDGETQTVYFLTEISENDLLNVTSDNSQTLPKNSAAVDSAIPITEAAVDDVQEETGQETPESETATETETEAGEDGDGTAITENPLFAYIIMGVVGAAVIAAVYFMKIKKKKEDFVDDDEDEEDDDDYDEEYDTDDGGDDGDDEDDDPDEKFLEDSDEEED